MAGRSHRAIDGGTVLEQHCRQVDTHQDILIGEEWIVKDGSARREYSEVFESEMCQ